LNSSRNPAPHGDLKTGRSVPEIPAYCATYKFAKPSWQYALWKIDKQYQ
jgi:hypothetical protein